MSHQALQFIIGTALTDGEFRRQLLLNPEKAAAAFDLTDGERAAVAAIRANGLEGFAHQLHCWISGQEGIPYDSPPCCLNSRLPPTPWPGPCLLSVR